MEVGKLSGSTHHSKKYLNRRKKFSGTPLHEVCVVEPPISELENKIYEHCKEIFGHEKIPREIRSLAYKILGKPRTFSEFVEDINANGVKSVFVYAESVEYSFFCYDMGYVIIQTEDGGVRFKDRNYRMGVFPSILTSRNEFVDSITDPYHSCYHDVPQTVVRWTAYLNRQGVEVKHLSGKDKGRNITLQDYLLNRKP